MRRSLPAGLAFLLLLGAPAARAQTEHDQLESLISDLDAGDWNARIRSVAMLGYMGDSARPGLAIAAQDGDWQVRMAAAHALYHLGSDAEPVLRSIVKNDPCRVVRLIALHNLGGLESGNVEAGVITDIFTDSPLEANRCVSQPGPGRLGAARPAKKTSTVVPVSGRGEGKSKKELSRFLKPTKKERYAELDSIFSNEPEKFPPGPPGANPRAESPGEAAYQRTTRPGAASALADRRSPSPEGPMSARFPPVHRDEAVRAPLLYGDADGKVAHDALPDLLESLRRGDARARARAADELGKMGRAAAPAVKPLIAATRDDSPAVRASACVALGNIGAASDPAVPLLVKALKDENVDIRYSAALALSRIPTARAHDAFHRYVREEFRLAVDGQAAP